MSELSMIVFLKGAPGNAEALSRAFAELVEATHREPGCLRYDLYRESEDSWICVETWKDAEAFEQHRQAPHLAVAGKLFATALAEPPRVIPCTAVKTLAR